MERMLFTKSAVAKRAIRRCFLKKIKKDGIVEYAAPGGLKEKPSVRRFWQRMMIEKDFR